MEANQKHPLLKLLLSDVGAFAGGSLVALGIFAVIFGTLNYFNILSLPSLYEPLSFLPRQEIQTKTVSQGETREPQNFSSAAFTYDAEKAKNIISTYLANTVKSEFLPATIEVKQGLSIDGRIEDVKHQFGAFFNFKGTTISANFHYQENTNEQNDYSIFIQQTDITQATATAAMANSLTSFYFNKPYLIAECGVKGPISYCENFQTIHEGKKGYGIVFAGEPKKLIKIVFTCLIPKDSRDYEAKKSCISVQ